MLTFVATIMIVAGLVLAIWTLVRYPDNTEVLRRINHHEGEAASRDRESIRQRQDTRSALFLLAGLLFLVGMILGS